MLVNNHPTSRVAAIQRTSRRGRRRGGEEEEDENDNPWPEVEEDIVLKSKRKKNSQASGGTRGQVKKVLACRYILVTIIIPQPHPLHLSLGKLPRTETRRILRQKPPRILNKQSKNIFLFSLILYSLIYVCGRAEKVLEGTGVSVALSSRRSGCLRPVSPKQQSSLASRQRCNTDEDDSVSEDEASPKSHSCSPDVQPHHRAHKSSPIQEETLASHGRSGSRTHPSNDEGIFIIIIKYFMYICINMHSLVDHNSVSRGRQKECGTSVVNPWVSTSSLRPNDQGNIIELAILLVLIYIRCFDS